VILIIHAYAQFNVLKYSLRTIRERAEELVTQEIIFVESSEIEDEISKHKNLKIKKKSDVTAG
jgi:hypothetical protein